MASSLFPRFPLLRRRTFHNFEVDFYSVGLTFSSYHRMVYSTDRATYPFVAQAEDELAEQGLALAQEGE
jgi:hypothetical protein